MLAPGAGTAQAEAWSGVYAGLHAGYAWGDTSIGEGGTDIGNPHVAPHGAFSCAPAVVPYCDVPMQVDTEGPAFGAQLGANWQSGPIVIGAEGEIGMLGADGDKLLFRPANDQDTASIDYDWYATLTGRLGYAFGHTLVYVKGGAAFADIAVTAADIDDGAIYQGSFTQYSKVHSGWTAGGGLEHALGDGVSIKAEYLYMDFGSETSGSSDGDIYKHEHELHMVKLGFNVRLAPL
jgi:outer membrane immunogenic protein